MRTFCVEVEHPHHGKMVRTQRTVEAYLFDQAVKKALVGFPEFSRPMSVIFEYDPDYQPSEVRGQQDLFSFIV